MVDDDCKVEKKESLEMLFKGLS
jgi:hypothetical protein